MRINFEAMIAFFLPFLVKNMCKSLLIRVKLFIRYGYVTVSTITIFIIQLSESGLFT